MKSVFEVITRPIISEKSTVQNELLRTYAFQVAPAANKQEIREAIEGLFKVKVEKVRTMLVHGKYKRSGRFVSKRNNWKKALVTLKEGQKIEFFQGV
ncbi:MAG: 50S ribosomal protein L23 [Deltaproteobacteria bacterium]|nr:50S ribosomal protein L23 [Deltaproteobacteria bacterium]